MINFGNLVALEEGGSKFVNNLEPESNPIHLSEGEKISDGCSTVVLLVGWDRMGISGGRRYR